MGNSRSFSELCSVNGGSQVHTWSSGCSQPHHVRANTLSFYCTLYLQSHSGPAQVKDLTGIDRGAVTQSHQVRESRQMHGYFNGMFFSSHLT